MVRFALAPCNNTVRVVWFSKEPDVNWDVKYALAFFRRSMEVTPGSFQNHTTQRVLLHGATANLTICTSTMHVALNPI